MHGCYTAFIGYIDSLSIFADYSQREVFSVLATRCPGACTVTSARTPGPSQGARRFTEESAARLRWPVCARDKRERAWDQQGRSGQPTRGLEVRHSWAAKDRGPSAETRQQGGADAAGGTARSVRFSPVRR
ncbi:hypothetical protein NDU88_005931 [Pleurodeles waltl]|uniref:Uncharacterized protein n=1 Tax=Pleurodeles waltl TaxID=8319 RepID=A0AAV7TY04_PLEWA|nr:hypothetical protein NDU88_005931 [Pleurodeles waltl]